MGINGRWQQSRGRSLGWPQGRSAAALLLSVFLAASAAVAHPVNMDCVTQQFRLRVGPDGVVVEAAVRYHEFPSIGQRWRMDANGNGVISGEELQAYSRKANEELLPYLVLKVNGEAVPLRAESQASIDLLGEEQVAPFHHEQLSTFSAHVAAAPGQVLRVEFATGAFADRPGFFRYWVVGQGARVVERSFAEEPAVDPDTFLAPGPAVRRITFCYELGEARAEALEQVDAPPQEPPAQRDTFLAGFRAFQKWVAAHFRREFRLGAFLLLVGAAFVYGAFHALAPGHAKTITAAYLIGSHARPRHAVLLGAVVTVSHTGSILALALVTYFFYGGEVKPQTHGLVMAASGGLIALLGVGQLVSRLRGRGRGGHDHPHDHGHEHPHGGSHLHLAHRGHVQNEDVTPDAHPHVHEHGHAHESAAEPITMKSLLLLGLSGGIVPCPGALWIYVLSVSLHRLLEGIILITALGAGLATVLTAVGLLTVRLRRSLAREEADGELRLVRRLPGMGGSAGRALDHALAWLGRSLAFIGPCTMALLGLVLVLCGLSSAGVLGGA